MTRSSSSTIRSGECFHSCRRTATAWTPSSSLHICYRPPRGKVLPFPHTRSWIRHAMECSIYPGCNPYGLVWYPSQLSVEDSRCFGNACATVGTIKAHIPVSVSVQYRRIQQDTGACVVDVSDDIFLTLSAMPEVRNVTLTSATSKCSSKRSSVFRYRCGKPQTTRQICFR